MPRSRNIKPSLFKNELLGEADPLLTILFTGLWCLADREGRMEDRPKRIKAEIFPYRDLPDFNGYLTVLQQLGFISRYEVGGCRYIQVENFARHQSPHKTERRSEIPEKPKESECYDSSVNAPLNNETITEEAALIPDYLIPDSLNNNPSKKYEEKTKKPAKRKSKIPVNFALTTELSAAALKYWHGKGRQDLNPKEEFEKFHTHHTAHGSTMLDWGAAWRTWFMNAVKFNRPGDGNGKHQSANRPLSEVDRIKAVNARRAEEREKAIQGGWQAADPGGDVLGEDDWPIHSSVDTQVRR